MENKEKARYTFWAIIGVAYHFATMGLTPATVNIWGAWALPINMVVDTLLVVGLLFLLPGGEPKSAAGKRANDFFKFNGGRFERGWWPELRRRSAFLMILATSFVAGAAATAFIVRILQIRGGRAYVYGIVAANIAITFKVLFWLGAFDVFTRALRSFARAYNLSS